MAGVRKLDPVTIKKFMEAHMEYRAPGIFWRNDIVRQGARPGRRIGCTDRYGYRNVSVAGKNVKEHHLVFLWHTGRWPAEIDHIDGVRDNNAIENLRECTRLENSRNRKKTWGASRHKGVSFHRKDGRWKAYIFLDGKPKTLGYFANEDDAGRVVDAAAKEHFGEFAALNFPDE